MPSTNRQTTPARRRHQTTGAVGHRASPSLFGQAVSFRVRRLEPLLAWAIAGCTLWVNVVINLGWSSVWWMALLAALIGGWSRVFPAHHQTVLLLRGALLVVGAFMLHLEPDSGGATGSYFFWPVLVTGFYAFLLSTGWAALLALLALLEFGLSCWLTPSSTSWQQTLALAGALTTMAALAIVYARSFHESDEQTESTLRDERTKLYNESGFFVHGAVLLAECRKSARPFSMVLLNGKDLRDIPELLGRKVANELFSQAVQAIAAIPGDGIAARVDSVEFALLLPGLTGERAAMLVKQRLGNPPQLEIKIEGKSIVIVMDMAVAQAKDHDQTVEELYDELHARWTQKNMAQQVAPSRPVLDDDDDRYADERRQASSTVPMHLQPSAGPKKTH
jgi:GGDEF domain-containing protein